MPVILAWKRLSFEMTRRKGSQRHFLTRCQLQRDSFAGEACLIWFRLVSGCVLVLPRGLPQARPHSLVIEKQKSRAGSQGEIFLHGSAHPTCSGHRHGRAGERAPRIRARHRHKLPFWHEVLPSGRKPHPSSSWVPFLNRVVVQTGEAQWGGRRRYH